MLNVTDAADGFLSTRLSLSILPSLINTCTRSIADIIWHVSCDLLSWQNMSNTVFYAKFALLFCKGDDLWRSSKENSRSWRNSAAKKIIVIQERR